MISHCKRKASEDGRKEIEKKGKKKAVIMISQKCKRKTDGPTDRRTKERKIYISKRVRVEKILRPFGVLT